MAMELESIGAPRPTSLASTSTFTGWRWVVVARSGAADGPVPDGPGAAGSRRTGTVTAGVLIGATTTGWGTVGIVTSTGPTAGGTVVGEVTMGTTVVDWVNSGPTSVGAAGRAVTGGVRCDGTLAGAGTGAGEVDAGVGRSTAATVTELARTSPVSAVGRAQRPSLVARATRK